MARGRGLAGARRQLDEIEDDQAAAGVDDSAALPPDEVDDDADYDVLADADDEEPDEPADIALSGGRRRSRIFQATRAALLVLALGFGIGI